MLLPPPIPKEARTSKLKEYLVKYGFLIILSGLVFYLVFPKYIFFDNDKGLKRANRITGKVEKLEWLGWKYVSK